MCLFVYKILLTCVLTLSINFILYNILKSYNILFDIELICVMLTCNTENILLSTYKVPSGIPTKIKNYNVVSSYFNVDFVVMCYFNDVIVLY